MTLQQLKYIIVIAETGSITMAAERLFIAQPSLSKAVAELEKEMGISIFNRSNRGVYLSEEGTKFLSYARQIVEQAELLESEYKAAPPPNRAFAVSSQHYAFVVNAFVELVREYGREKYEFSLRELKNTVAAVIEKKLPKYAQLMEMHPVIVARTMVDGATLTAYENGYAVYEQDGAHTVMAIDRCGDYRYDFNDGTYEIVPAEVFEEAEWTVRMVMEGERRLENIKNDGLGERHAVDGCLIEIDKQVPNLKRKNPLTDYSFLVQVF